MESIAADQTPQDNRDNREKLAAALVSGANWFYWIAGLSMVNTLLHLFGSEMNFIIGLGVTLVVDFIAIGGAKEASPAVGTVLKVVALGFSLLVAGIFVLFGWLSRKRKGWAFLLGMVLYAMDGLIFLLFREWLSVAFHGFALVGLFGGYAALRKLRAIEDARPDKPIVP